LYIETLEEILRTSTKVLVDTEGGNNLLYLPLDQLMQRRTSTAPIEPVPMSSTVAPPPSVGSDRSRERATTR
jgi:membrane protease subunit HflK